MAEQLLNEAVLNLLDQADQESSRAWLTKAANSMLLHHEQQVQFWKDVIAQLSGDVNAMDYEGLSPEEKAIPSMAHITRPCINRSRASSSIKLAKLHGDAINFDNKGASSSKWGKSAEKSASQDPDTLQNRSANKVESNTTQASSASSTSRQDDAATEASKTVNREPNRSIMKMAGMQQTFSSAVNDDLKSRLQSVLQRNRSVEADIGKKDQNSSDNQPKDLKSTGNQPPTPSNASASQESASHHAKEDRSESNQHTAPPTSQQEVETKRCEDTHVGVQQSSQPPRQLPPPLPFTPNNLVLPDIPVTSPTSVPPSSTTSQPLSSRSSAPPPLPACPPPLPPLLPTPVAGSQSSSTTSSSSVPPPLPDIPMTPSQQQNGNHAPTEEAAAQSLPTSSFKPVGAKTLLRSDGVNNELFEKLQRRRIE